MWVIIYLVSQMLVVARLQQHLELRGPQAAFVYLLGLKPIAANMQFSQLALQYGQFQTQVQHCPHEHITADASKTIEIENLHVMCCML